MLVTMTLSSVVMVTVEHSEAGEEVGEEQEQVMEQEDEAEAAGEEREEEEHRLLLLVDLVCMSITWNDSVSTVIS